MCAEDQPRDEVTKCDIDRHHRRPAADEHGLAEDTDEDRKERHWDHCRPHRRHHWHGRAPPRMQHTTRRRCFDDFLRHEREKQRHRPVVDEDTGGIDETVVGFGVPVRPDERESCAEREGE